MLPSPSPLPSQGLIFLDARSAILHEQLKPRILDGKREACDITFSDFDDVKFRISSNEQCPNIIKVNMFIRAAKELKTAGSKELIERLFPGRRRPRMQTTASRSSLTATGCPTRPPFWSASLCSSAT